ncbi:CRM-domain containing factor CFM9, mitochondrial [Vigna umbellata]|uniref:CRM-domain containing factor CFM9, mitochondrial n=1 Tax=Vigna umbellata TaxID=87088 RepID=UPI001F5FECF9|nr:CRM-domain containing factor CFM9, mitochondrial [Vigna umbellata]
MFGARNLQRHCFKHLSSLFQLQSNVVPLARRPECSNIVKVEVACHRVGLYCYVQQLNLLNGSLWSRAMSTSKGRSMRSKVEKRMQKESGKTLREIRRAKKLKKKLMTEEERLVYNLKRAKKKVALLLQKLKKYELPDLPPPRHDPELLTPEQLQAFKKIGFRNKNYVPVGVRGVFGGVVQNMHLHWKFHETVQVCCDNFPKEKIKEMASMLARLSGGIVINVHNVKTIIMFRGRNYRQPKNLIPINTLTKRKALFKARFEQALESQKLNIKKIEQQLRRMGVNPEDPAAMASIQRVASTFFNAIDKKEGTPYVFREGKQSIIEPPAGLEESEPTVDSDQEELDRFISEIEDAADKEYEAEEAKEKEEFGRIRYWNKEEFGGRYKRSDASRNDDHDVDARGSRVWQSTQSKRHAIDSDDEESAHSDNDDDDDDDEWRFNNVDDASDLDSNSNGYEGSRGRFKESRRKREKQNNPEMGQHRDNRSSNRHAGAKFRSNVSMEDSESEGMFSDVENAMWECEDEENNDSGNLRKFNDNNYDSGSSDDEYTHQAMRNNKSDVKKDHKGKVGDSAKYHNSFGAPKSLRGKHGVNKVDSESVDEFSGSENWLWPSDAEGDARDEGDYPTKQNNNVIKSDDIPKRRTPKDADEAWDSD